MSIQTFIILVFSGVVAWSLLYAFIILPIKFNREVINEQEESSSTKE